MTFTVVLDAEEIAEAIAESLSKLIAVTVDESTIDVSFDPETGEITASATVETLGHGSKVEP